MAPQDGLALQRDLDHLQCWSARWGLVLNPVKCKTLTVTLRRAPVRTTYHINGTPLEIVNEMRDLGVVIDSKLNFASHVSRVVRQANRALGLLIRSFQTGTRGAKFNQKTLLVTYFANVRSILEYSCVIWAGAAKTHTERADRVQHKFLLWLNRHTTVSCPSLSYNSLLNHFGIPSLSARRVQYDLLFLRNVFSGKINSADLVAQFSLHVPPRSTRSQRLFAEHPWRVCAIRDGFLRRTPKVMNVFLSVSGADLFNDDFSTFRCRVMRYVRSLT